MMNVFLSGVILVLALASFVKSESVENEIDEKRFFSWIKFCKTHENCPSNQYCKVGHFISRCQRLPYCGYYGRRCPGNLRCNKRTRRCERPGVKPSKHCHSHSQCDSNTECCASHYGHGHCRKRPTEGQMCYRGNRYLCRVCVPGLECATSRFRHSYGKCRTPPTTAPPTTTPPPTTEEPGSGSGEMAELALSADE